MLQIINLKTKYYFGKDCLAKNLAIELKAFKAKKILLMYGNGSIKKNHHLYDDIIQYAKLAGCRIYECAGISPNPKDDECLKAIKIAKKNKIDLIIAAGGGSVIDAAKIVSSLTNNNFVSVEQYCKSEDCHQLKNPCVPIFSIITLAATGSENNAGSVITFRRNNNKKGHINSDQAIPAVCFADPTYTFSVNRYQTACGIFDIFSHLMEAYFSQKQNLVWGDNYIFANIKTLLTNMTKVLKSPNNYEARANILFTSSMALNNLISSFSNNGDWTVHKMEHAISGRWDVTHGAGLALLTPIYFQYMIKNNKIFRAKALKLNKEVFNSSNINSFINNIKNIITKLKLPKKYTDFVQIKKVNENDINWLIDHTCMYGDNTKRKIYRYVFNQIRI